MTKLSNKFFCKGENKAKRILKQLVPPFLVFFAEKKKSLEVKTLLFDNDLSNYLLRKKLHCYFPTADVIF